MQRFAGVFFHVHACDADVGRRAVVPHTDLEAAAGRERPVVLRDLVALGKVGIEIVLAREDRDLVNVAAKPQRRAQRQLHGPLVEDRQRAWKRETHRTDVRIRRIAERGRTAAEGLGTRLELHVDLETNYHLVIRSRFSARVIRSRFSARAFGAVSSRRTIPGAWPPPIGVHWCASAPSARSSADATANMRFSSKWAAMSCPPAGSFPTGPLGGG